VRVGVRSRGDGGILGTICGCRGVPLLRVAISYVVVQGISRRTWGMRWPTVDVLVQRGRLEVVEAV
jgi:hypothetical protein